MLNPAMTMQRILIDTIHAVWVAFSGERKTEARKDFRKNGTGLPITLVTRVEVL